MGLALRVMPVGVSSSSVIVVVTDFEPYCSGSAPGHRRPRGSRLLTVNVSPVPSSKVSSVVWTVKVCAPAAACREGQSADVLAV